MGCNCDNGCLLATVISIFLGAIIGVLFYFGFISAFVVGTWVAFGIAVLALVGLVVIGNNRDKNNNICICAYGRCLLAGIIGTIVSAIVALAIELTTASVVSAIVAAVLGLFFSLLIITIVLFIKCLIETNCRFRE